MTDISTLPLEQATQHLFAAVQKKRSDIVASILAARPETAKTRIGTQTALILLANTAPPEIELSNDDNRHLYWASVSIGTLLLKHDCNINAMSFDGATALMCALQRGCLRISSKILDQNPDLSIVGEGNASVLYIALTSRPLKDIDTLDPAETVSGVVRTLIDRGAPAHGPDGENILEYFPNMNTNLFEILLEKNYGVNLKNQDGVLPAAALAAVGHWVAVLKILKTGGRFDAIDKHGRTLDEIARSQGREDMVAKLHEMRLNLYLQAAANPKPVKIPLRKNL